MRITFLRHGVFFAIFWCFVCPDIALAQTEDKVCRERSFPEGTSEETKTLLCKFEGKTCEREEKERGLDPDSDASPIYYAATEAAIKACGGLGCIAHSDPALPQTVGMCGIPQEEVDCAGLDTDIDDVKKKYGGRCGEFHEEPQYLDGFHPERLLLTGALVVDSAFEGGTGFTSGFAVGALYQVSFTSSKSEPLEGGGYLHYDLPIWYLHVSGFGSDDKVGYDVGSVWKTGGAWLSRYGLTFTGQIAKNKEKNHVVYRTGPGLHIEIYYNILIKGGVLLLGNHDGPLWMTTLEYNYNLLNDFKTNTQ